MGDVEYGKIYDIYFPPPYLRLFDGPAVNIVDMWRILGRAMVNGGLVVGTIIKPKLGLRPKPFGEACYAFWQGGDFIKNDEPLRERGLFDLVDGALVPRDRGEVLSSGPVDGPERVRPCDTNFPGLHGCGASGR
jgi:ribulose 1,5-bisphosphate carboxylase large subunit-like protein